MPSTRSTHPAHADNGEILRWRNGELVTITRRVLRAPPNETGERLVMSDDDDALMAGVDAVLTAAEGAPGDLNGVDDTPADGHDGDGSDEFPAEQGSHCQIRWL